MVSIAREGYDYPAFRAELLWMKLKCEPSQDDLKYIKDQYEPPEWSLPRTATQDMPTHKASKDEQKDDRNRAERLRLYVQSMYAGADQYPKFEKLRPEDFLFMLKHADWRAENTASKIVNGRLWLADFNPKPEFLVLSSLDFRFPLRLNGRALNLPETDFTTCKSYGIETVLPNLYAGVRFRPLELDTPLSTLCLVVLGNILTTCGIDSGFVLTANLALPDPSSGTRVPRLYLIHNFTDEDFVNEEDWANKLVSYSFRTRSRGSATMFKGSELLSLPMDLLSQPPHLYIDDMEKLSAEKPEFVELGLKKNFSEGEPIPLFPRSDSKT